MKRGLLFIFSCCLLFLALGQEQQEEADSTVTRRILTPSILLDYGKLLTIPFDFETKYEGGIELLILEKYPLILEAGAATLRPEGAFSNGTYESKGNYLRFGTGIYSNPDPEHTLGFSVRYGMSTFSERRTITIQSSSGVQDTFTNTTSRDGLTASWFEAVIYSDRKLNDLLSIGLNIRLRVLIDYDQQTPVDVYAIPGYGRSFDNTIPALNLFIKASF